MNEKAIETGQALGAVPDADPPEHRAGCCTVDNLPERIRSPQDIEDIFDRFEVAANRHARARMPYTGTGEEQFTGRRFIDAHDLLLVRDEDVKELHATLRSDRTNTIPMRHALNALRNFVESLERIRKELGMPEVDGPRDDMAFYYQIADEVRRLRCKVKDQYELIGQQTELIEQLKTKASA